MGGIKTDFELIFDKFYQSRDQNVKTNRKRLRSSYLQTDYRTPQRNIWVESRLGMVRIYFHITQL
jgi:hypothetical protein